MSTYECRESRLMENYPHSILEYNEHGFVIGAYTGYYNSRCEYVMLYPNYRHPALKGSFKLEKRKVSDRLIRCRKQNLECGIQEKPAVVKSQTSRAMKDIVGQEKMKF